MRSRAQTLNAKDVKYGFGRLIDLARAEPFAVARHEWPAVALPVEESERFKVLESVRAGESDQRQGKTDSE